MLAAANITIYISFNKKRREIEMQFDFDIFGLLGTSSYRWKKKKRYYILPVNVPVIPQKPTVF